MPSLLRFIGENSDKLLEQTLEHIGLTFLSLLIAVLIAVPAGILAIRYRRLATPLLGFAGIMQTIPSIALLGFLLPLLGIGVKPAIVALFLYALLPIMRNTYTGIQEVAPSVREAAVGMGMTYRQILRKVELPLALPVILAGIRTATVINVGVATLAAYIGAGGLGEFIFGGIALNNNVMILAGAIPAALLAIFFDQILGSIQHRPLSKLGRPAAIFSLLFIVLPVMGFMRNTFSDQLKFGSAPEFMGRPDGYNHLVATYGLEFNTVILTSALLYKAVRDGQVDVISGYSTDGRIKAFDLKLLEDNRLVFPPYYCTPIVNMATLEKHPEIEEVLHLLRGRINDSTMTELNYRVDHLKEPPDTVARHFLEDLGLWKPDRRQGGPTITIASKIFTEQYILTALFSQLINGYTDLDTDIKNGLGGTKICFEALRQGEIDIYPEYTGTGFLVLLQPEEATVQELISNADGVYEYVSREFEKEYGIKWLEPLGFNNTYALMVRRKWAEEIEVEKISELKTPK